MTILKIAGIVVLAWIVPAFFIGMVGGVMAGSAMAFASIMEYVVYIILALVVAFILKILGGWRFVVAAVVLVLVLSFIF